MIEKIIKTCKVIIFGKSALDGYYSSERKSTKDKNYVFSSVFPSSETMKKALSELSYENR